MLIFTSLNPRSTDKPSTSSKIKSNTLAETIIKSKIFQPFVKNSLLRAISFIVHSKVKMEVNTCKILNIDWFLCNTKLSAFTIEGYMTAYYKLMSSDAFFRRPVCLYKLTFEATIGILMWLSRIDRTIYEKCLCIQLINISCKLAEV